MRNFKEYHRPESLADASTLLRRPSPRTAVLAGGTWLTGEAPSEVEAVVDIAKLGLDTIQLDGKTLRIGAATTLAALASDPIAGAAGSSAGLRILGETALAMAGASIRNRATIGGAIVTADAASPLVTALLACDAEVVVYGLLPRNSNKESDLYQTLALGALLDYGDQLVARGGLLTEIRVIVPSADTQSRFERVARTPKDYPIVCAAVQFAHNKGVAGNMRAAVGGVASKPKRLGRLEFGIEKKNINEFIDAELRAEVEALTPPDDFLGSADYRRDMARVLTRRAIMAIA
jgi:aerobic carbon-monoxide dehydrogenase medium subunit